MASLYSISYGGFSYSPLLQKNTSFERLVSFIIIENF